MHSPHGGRFPFFTAFAIANSPILDKVVNKAVIETTTSEQEKTQ